jgi:hypothetical protein
MESGGFARDTKRAMSARESEFLRDSERFSSKRIVPRTQAMSRPPTRRFQIGSSID